MGLDNTFMREQAALHLYEIAAVTVGEAAQAAPYLRAGLNTQVFLTTKTLPRDPWFDKLRGQPEFEALLKDSAVTK